VQAAHGVAQGVQFVQATQRVHCMQFVTHSWHIGWHCTHIGWQSAHIGWHATQW